MVIHLRIQEEMGLTGGLEDKVDFHREVFLVDVVLTGGMEVELSQSVGLAVGCQ